MQICSRCIFDARTPGIIFDDQGVCNYCKQVDHLSKEYQTGLPAGEARLQELIAEIKKWGRNRKYNCVIGVSGGTDSSYLLIKAKEWGLRPLAVHYDNTWNSSIATQNIQKVTSALDVDLYTYVIDNKEADDIFRAFLLAGVPEFDASTDIAFAQVLRLAAASHGIKYILEGHSFVAEGVSPQANNYFDGKYIQSVHRMFGSRKLVTYPNLTLLNFLKWSIIYRQKFVRPLWYINYSKSDARKLLHAKTGWKYYGGHHLENRATAFLHTVYNPQKFSIDNRNWSLSAEARTGVIAREDALAIYQKPVPEDRELVNYVKKRLGLSDDDYTAVMNGPKRSYRDFETYKKTFERLRFLFFILARANLVPKSFYLKYCFPHKAPA
jgi:N-acetyl sugar amidotransferase